MRLIILILLSLSSLYATSSYEFGKKLYIEKTCFSCHGQKLEGMHMYPALANRAKGFLTYKLKQFRNKLSNNQQQEMMVAFAINLSDEDIDNLTTFMTDFVSEESKDSYDDSFETWGDGGS